MDEILVLFLLPGGAEVWMNVAQDMAVLEALELLARKGRIAPLAEDLGWSVRCEDDPRTIDVWRTFAQNGLEDGAELHVRQSPDAPRAPGERNAWKLPPPRLVQFRPETLRRPESGAPGAYWLPVALPGDMAGFEVAGSTPLRDVLRQLRESGRLAEPSGKLRWRATLLGGDEALDPERTLEACGCAPGRVLSVYPQLVWPREGAPFGADEWVRLRLNGRQSVYVTAPEDVTLLEVFEELAAHGLLDPIDGNTRWCVSSSLYGARYSEQRTMAQNGIQPGMTLRVAQFREDPALDAGAPGVRLRLPNGVRFRVPVGGMCPRELLDKLEAEGFLAPLGLGRWWRLVREDDGRALDERVPFARSGIEDGARLRVMRTGD